MLDLNEIVALLAAVLGSGGMIWALWTKLRDRNDDLRAEREENQRLQEQNQKVTNDAMERRAEESVQREQGDAAKRLRESKWVRED